MSLLPGFLANMLIVVAIVFAASFICALLAHRWSTWVWGCLSGMGGMLLFYAGVTLAPGRVADFRHVLVLVAGYAGGMPAVLAATAITAAYRFAVGGAGAVGGLIAMVTFGLLGAWLHHKRLRPGQLKLWYWALIGVGSIAIAHVIIFASDLEITVQNAINHAAVSLAALTPLAVYLCFVLLDFFNNSVRDALLLRSLMTDTPLYMAAFENKRVVFASVGLREDPLLSQALVEPLSVLTDHVPDGVTLADVIDTGTKADECFNMMMELGNRTFNLHAARNSVAGQDGTIALFAEVTDRLRAMDALRKSESRLRSVLRSAPIGMVVTDGEGRLLSANPAFCRMLGYDEAELRHKTVFDLTHPDDCDTSQIVLEAARRGDPVVRVQKRYRRKDGAAVWAQVTVAPMKRSSGAESLILAMIEDVTEHKRATDDLERFVTVSPDVMAVIGFDGAVIKANPAFYAALGYAGADLAGRSLFDLVHPDDTEAVSYDADALAASHDLGIGLAARFRSADGTYKWFEWNEAPLPDEKAWYVVARDATARRNAEESQRLMYDLMRLVFDSNPDMMAICSRNGHQIVMANRSLVSTLGYPEEEILGRGLSDLGFSHVDQRNHEQVAANIRGRGTVQNVPMTFKTKTGETRSGLMSASHVEWNGQTHILVSINDVTVHEKMQAELARLDQLNVVAQMAAGIGHEVRNPLTTVRGFLELLSSRRDSQDDHKRYYGMMIDELDRATEIINDYLAMARNKPTQLAERNLNDILGAICPLIKADAAIQGKELCLLLDPTLPETMLNEQEVRQLVLNLARNGLEAMKAGQELTIKTSICGGSIALSIRDSGSGIPPTIRERIGTPFFTTKEHGTGLGLSVCYSIAAHHNATITFESGPAGTEFVVKFPMVSAPARAETAAASDNAGLFGLKQ